MALEEVNPGQVHDPPILQQGPVLHSIKKVDASETPANSVTFVKDAIVEATGHHPAPPKGVAKNNNGNHQNVCKQKGLSFFQGSGTFNCLCCPYPTPIVIDSLRPLLANYPNKKAANIIEEGFSNGFKLGYRGERRSREGPNLKSVDLKPSAAGDKLMKEVNLNRMAGPFNSSPLPNLIISPIGLVPKAEVGKFRLIQHLSYPEGNSINDGIDKALCTVHYAKFDDAVHLVSRNGKGALMAKADVESAFRLLPIFPGDFELLGIKFNGKFFVDKSLPMGASCSPFYFETFSTFLEWAGKRESGSDNISHYVDDFIFVSSAGGGLSCQHIVNSFNKVCKELGVPLAKDKSVAPTTKLVYLGLEIDSVRQVISIPTDKLQKIIAKVQNTLNSSKVTLRDLQSVIGSLSFVCKAINPGRAFLRRLIDLSCGVKQAWHKIRITQGASRDLKMWLVFLQSFNGSAIIPDQFWCEDRDLQFFTDASGVIGFGGFFRGNWFQGRWPEKCKSEKHSIAWLEFFPVVVAIVVWGRLLKGKRVIIRSDNAAVVAIINKQSSKCPEIMKLVRFFVLQCLKDNVVFSARHIPGVKNNIADALSRFQMDRFREYAPGSSLTGILVPEFIWNL